MITQTFKGSDQYRMNGDDLSFRGTTTSLILVLSLAVATLAVLIVQPGDYIASKPQFLDVVHASPTQVQEFERTVGPLASPSSAPNELHIDLVFSGGSSTRPSSFARFENLFQTDSFDRGLRLELSPPKRLALVYPPTGATASGAILTEDLELGVAHRLRVQLSSKAGIQVSIDGESVMDVPGAPFVISLANVRAGVGYNDRRRFSGEVEELTLVYSGSHLKRPLLRSVLVALLFVLVVALFCALVARSFDLRRDSWAEELIRPPSP